MCGIVEYVHKNQPYETKVIQDMMERIHHRGPDDGEYYNDEKVGLGFRRLSITDMSKNANQPMFCENRRFILIFNG